MVRQEDKDKLLIHIEICMCYTVKRNLQIGICQSVIEDKIMFFGYYQFHESNYAILHMQKGAIASQEKHINGIQF